MLALRNVFNISHFIHKSCNKLNYITTGYNMCLSEMLGYLVCNKVTIHEEWNKIPCTGYLILSEGEVKTQHAS